MSTVDLVSFLLLQRVGVFKRLHESYAVNVYEYIRSYKTADWRQKEVAR
jgi:hypothetical protein